jgi:hypothetical protein
VALGDVHLDVKLFMYSYLHYILKKTFAIAIFHSIYTIYAREREMVQKSAAIKFQILD